MGNSKFQTNYLDSVIKQLKYYKILGESTFEQLNEKDLFIRPSKESNSIGIIVNHLWGNMKSRWTDMLTSDGEKKWRKRDQEFEDIIDSYEKLIQKWEEGWDSVFITLNSLQDVDLNRILYIRNIGHTVTEALNRQMTHYAYHVGQIVFIGKWVRNNNWQSLSIPKNESEKFNQIKFKKEKHRGHYTDDYLNNDNSGDKS